ncbi:MAG: ion transporter [Candidatus Riflebacteria bacterium]|nr:ion transporter [Candidatus Riflebacteria bacterium]
MHRVQTSGSGTIGQSVGSLRRTIHRALNPDGAESGPERHVTRAMVLLIILSTVSAICETSEACRQWAGRALVDLELVTTWVFTLEYLVRLWSCTVDPRYSRPVTGRLRYALTPLALVDLMAVLPYYLSAGGITSLVVLRCLRLIRLMRVLKLVHYTPTLRLFAHVIRNKGSEIGVALLLNLLLVVVASSLIYVAENGQQPAVFSSIPASMWWAVITLTTVGYGDAYPVTVLGKLLTACVAVLGVGLFALPAGLLASGFVEQALQRQIGAIHCPHCGNPLEKAA